MSTKQPQARPLMPMGVAAWLVFNTGLTFKQIGDFCGLHEAEVQNIADGGTNIIAYDPIGSNQLTEEEITRCEADAESSLKLADSARQYVRTKTKGARYTPIARRQDKPDAIAWLLKHHAYIPDARIARLIGTTKKTIDAVRERTHWNSSHIKPRDPVLLGLCLQTHLDELVNKYRPENADDQQSVA